MRPITLVFPPLFVVAPALAGPVTLTVDQTSSTAEVELCLTLISTACDTDTTPVAGTVTVAFDCPPAPDEIILHDFAFELVDDVTLELNFGTGMFNSVGRDVLVSYADPGLPLPPQALSNGDFSLTGVPADATGSLDYDTTGYVCTLFNLGGYPRADTIDLSTITLQPLEMTGTVNVSGDSVSLSVDITVSGPIDPDNPSLGTIYIDGTVLAHGTNPPPCCPGDLTGDDHVGLDDHGRVAACLFGPGTTATGVCRCADIDTDGDVDLEDFAKFQVSFQGE